jgi:DICT domain-containing protein
MGIDQYILNEFLVLDPVTLSETQKDQLVTVFDKYASMPLPSIIEQLKTKNFVRKAIDLAILNVLGINGNQSEILDKAYATMVETIMTLAALMKKGQNEE